MRKLLLFALLSIIIICSFFVFYENFDAPLHSSSNSNGQSKDRLTGKAIEQAIYEQDRPMELYFCPKDDCMSVLIEMVNQSTKIHCAIYNINDKSLLSVLEQKGAKVVIDKNYAKHLANYSIDYKTNDYALMHDKFCIFDDASIFTGSFNAVRNKDNNNLIIIYSKQLAKNYEDEFSELWSKKYDEKTKNPKVVVNGIEFDNYFCPEDWCANKIIQEIKAAKKSIYFMTFSFTHDEISDLLIQKYKSGLNVSGIFEKNQLSNFSDYYKLKEAGIDVVLDKNKQNMHHKVFIIDGSVVITGSMNPTKNGDLKNDENIIIIRNHEVARRFTDEFYSLK